MRRGFAAGGKSLESPAVYDEDIEPAVVIVIVKRDATAGGLKQILVLVFSTEDRFGIQAGFARDVQEANAEIRWRRRRAFLLTRILAGRRGSAQPGGESHFPDVFEGQHQRGPAERLQEQAA